MNKQFMADKENLKDRNLPLRSVIPDPSHKVLANLSKRDSNTIQDKSARVMPKKEAPRITGLGLHLPVSATTIQNISRKVALTVARPEEAHKETSLPQKKNIAPNFVKSSMLNTYLSRDKELRLPSKPKQKKDEDAEKRATAELLQHSKSILQIAGIGQKVQTMLNPARKVPGRVKDPNDVSSLSNLSELSDVSRNHKHAENRAVEQPAFKSTDKNPSFNFIKEKKNFFGKKPDPTLRLPVKHNFTSVNKSKAPGSQSSIENTPDKVEKTSGLEAGRPQLSTLLAHPLNLKAKVEATKAVLQKPKLKKEKLLCLENLILKPEGPLSAKTMLSDHSSFHQESTFLTKGPTKKRELTIEEEISNFVQENQNGVYTAEMISNLIQSEAEYMPDPYYLEKNQNELTWLMRAMLLDWLIEVSSDFTLKISTFHYAVNYIDRFLSQVSNVQKANFQLVGLTALSLATKLEEVYVPHLSDFAVSAGNIFSVDTIKKMELFMLKTLKWKITPPTLHIWANWYACRWDFFLENSPECKTHPLVLHHAENRVMFKQMRKDSYCRYRELMQLLDCALLDVQTLQYKLRPLVAAFMYIILGKDYGQFSLEQITDTFRTSSLYLLDKTFAYNDLFSKFLDKEFGFELEDLLPCIQYASTYFSLNISQQPPAIVRMNPQGIAEGHFEEFLAYEIHNADALEFVNKGRPRNLV